MPSFYRFRIVNADGKVVGDTELGVLNDTGRGECWEGVAANY